MEVIIYLVEALDKTVSFVVDIVVVADIEGLVVDNCNDEKIIELKILFFCN